VPQQNAPPRIPEFSSNKIFFLNSFDKMPPSCGEGCENALYNDFWKLRISQEGPSLLIMPHSNNFVLSFLPGVRFLIKF
jgi:hypothetical protein